MNETYEHDDLRLTNEAQPQINTMPLNSMSIDPNDIAKTTEETHAALDTLAAKAKENQASYNYTEFAKFVNAFYHNGLHDPHVFHVMLRARGHKVTLTGAPGELIVSVRAVAAKPSLFQRIKKLFV